MRKTNAWYMVDAVTGSDVANAQFPYTATDEWLFIAYRHSKDAYGDFTQRVYMDLKPEGGSYTSSSGVATNVQVGKTDALRLLISDSGLHAEGVQIAHVAMWNTFLSDADMDAYAGASMGECGAVLPFEANLIGYSQRRGGIVVEDV
eukprot:4463383-Pleurochrysis_carterae.AAC.1